MPVLVSSVGGTSVGYGGAIDEVAWAQLAPVLGAKYGVLDAASWRVSTVTSADRTIQIAAGSGFGTGIFDTIPVPVNLQLPIVASGSRWDLIVARRAWAGASGTTEFDRIAATAAGDLPSGRLQNPGVSDEQPIALVQVTAGQSLPTAIIDLRVWQANGGAVAVSEKVLQYLTEPGTRVSIGTTLWSRDISTAGVASWQRTDLESRYARLWSASDPSTRIWPAGTGHMISLTVTGARAGWYRVDALAVVRQASGSTQPFQKMFQLNGAQYGMAVMDELPNATWSDRALARAFLWGGGSFTVSYLGITSGSDTTVQLAELYATYLGASGW